MTRPRDTEAFVKHGPRSKKALVPDILKILLRSVYGIRSSRNFVALQTPRKPGFLVVIKPTAIHLDWPIVIIETEYPPSPLPVTVGCVAALFVPPPDTFMGEKASSSRYLSSQYLPSSFELNTSFYSPRVLNPISTYKLEPWKIPTRKQQEHVLEVLDPIMNIKQLNFVWPCIIVELCTDDRVYATHSLPGRIAGCTTLYHRSELTYLQDMKPWTRERLIDLF